MSEDDDEQPVKMVKPSATLRPKVSTFSNVADAVNKVSSLLYSLCFSTQHLLFRRPTTLPQLWIPKMVRLFLGHPSSL